MIINSERYFLESYLELFTYSWEIYGFSLISDLIVDGARKDFASSYSVSIYYVSFTIIGDGVRRAYD